MYANRRNNRRSDGISLLFPILTLCLVALLGSPAALAKPKGVNWFDDRAVASTSGAPMIRVKLSEQRAYFYKGGKLVGISKVSSGKKGFSTGTGNFRVLSKHPHHRSSIYGSFVSRSTGRVIRSNVNTRRHRRPAGSYYRGAKMNNYIRFNGGIGFHASNNVPNYPASHGCVRMPPHMAQKFYRHAPVGTRVKISY